MKCECTNSITFGCSLQMRPIRPKNVFLQFVHSKGVIERSQIHRLVLFDLWSTWSIPSCNSRFDIFYFSFVFPFIYAALCDWTEFYAHAMLNLIKVHFDMHAVTLHSRPAEYDDMRFFFVCFFFFSRFYRYLPISILVFVVSNIFAVSHRLFVDKLILWVATGDAFLFVRMYERRILVSTNVFLQINEKSFSRRWQSIYSKFVHKINLILVRFCTRQNAFVQRNQRNSKVSIALPMISVSSG